MASFKVPLVRPQPDAQAFIRAVTTDWEPPRPRLVEYLVNPPVMQAVLEMMGRKWVSRDDGDPTCQQAFWDNFIAFWHGMGYDFVRMELGDGLPSALPARRRYETADHTAAGDRGTASEPAQAPAVTQRRDAGRHLGDCWRGMIGGKMWEDSDRLIASLYVSR